MSAPDPTARPEDGVWVSYYPDGSGVFVHENEVSALREAVSTSRSVVFLHWDQCVADATRQLPF